MGELKRANSLTIKQKKFLLEYQQSLSLKEACKSVGYSMQTLHALLRKETLFTKSFRELQSQMEKDPRFTKAAGLERLMKWMRAAEEDGDYKTCIAIQKEINQMVEGNIALNKVVETKKEVTVNIIDFTKRNQMLPQGNDIIDITDMQ